ncbi:MAG: hypothetical protein H6765_00885 [Candidatus Peribacteria bacterium]|nr:MAG: hypothetical protein H6765_00885 [Candidatus Peribacteria bacterium]
MLKKLIFSALAFVTIATIAQSCASSASAAKSEAFSTTVSSGQNVDFLSTDFRLPDDPVESLKINASQTVPISVFTGCKLEHKSETRTNLKTDGFYESYFTVVTCETEVPMYPYPGTILHLQTQENKAALYEQSFIELNINDTISNSATLIPGETMTVMFDPVTRTSGHVGMDALGTTVVVLKPDNKK